MYFSFKNSKKNPIWTEKDRLLMVELNNKNMSISDIAKRFEGRTVNSVSSAIKRMGWKVNNTN